MIVDVIGTSCTWFKRNNTSFVIDKEIILDTPNGAYKNIIKIMNQFKANAIIISHFHSDHFPDIMHFLTQIVRNGKRNGRTEKLKVFGPKGIAQKIIALNELLLSTPEECNLEKYKEAVEFIEVSDGYEFEILNYKVKAYKMKHLDLDAYGYVFTDKNGMSVGFTADTGMCENVHKILSISKYAFVDMASPENEVNNKHLSLNEFIELSKKYSKTKMFPVHTSDENQEKAKLIGLNWVDDGQVLELE